MVLVTLDDGRIMFWDHELELPDALVQLAPDFRAFWNGLRRFDPSTVRLEPGQVKSAWIDPELLD